MIKLSKVNKKYSDKVIYDKATYIFRDKALTCFYGESGSGKTTLFNILAGFDTKFEGEVVVNGRVLGDIDECDLGAYRCENIGFIFQHYHLLKGYTALENVVMALHQKNELTDEEKNVRALEILKTVGLEAEVSQLIETLSGGQKQRVAIARALVNNPSIILADEPTGALDIENTEAIMTLLKQISREKTVIIITHDEEVMKYADDVVTLEDYKVKLVKSNSNTREIEQKKITNPLKKMKLPKKQILELSKKNFSINRFKYLLVAVMLAFSVAAFIASFSAKDISNRVMEEFKEKNSHYTVGQVFKADLGGESLEQVYNELSKMESIENVYKQGNLKDIVLKQGKFEVPLSFNSPAEIAKQSLAYGRLPHSEASEIALSASLAGGLSEDIKSLIGVKLVFEYKDARGQIKQEEVSVTGITNNPNQNFILSSDLEKKIYNSQEFLEEDFSAISFEVKVFDAIPEVRDALEEAGMPVIIRAEEVEVFETTFKGLTQLFTLLSYLICIVGIVISTTILYKKLGDRKHEFAILGAIGYNDQDIKEIVIREGMRASAVTMIGAGVLLIGGNMLAKQYIGYGLSIGLIKCVVATAIIILVDVGLSWVICDRLLKKDKSILLR